MPFLKLSHEDKSDWRCFIPKKHHRHLCKGYLIHSNRIMMNNKIIADIFVQKMDSFKNIQEVGICDA